MKLRSCALITALFILFLFMPRANAADGTVLINQSTSINGLPGCPHSGFPISICQPGSYRLSGNLTVSDPGKDAIDISAGNVTLDLNGFTISGPGVCTGIPISLCTAPGARGIFAPGDSISVLNGVVTSFTSGGVFVGNFSSVDELRVTSNIGTGLVVGISSNVTRSIVAENGGHGIAASGPAMVTGNMVYGNQSDGVFASLSTTLSNNTVIQNGSVGISVGCPSLIIGNTLTANTGGALNAIGSGCVDVNNAK